MDRRTGYKPTLYNIEARKRVTPSAHQQQLNKEI